MAEAARRRSAARRASEAAPHAAAPHLDLDRVIHERVRLAEAGYVECRKSFEGRVPRTEYRLTAAGRRALQRYLDHMEALIRATRER